jgi:cytokinin riboside 5'-monophosphate phosphoribohydrolase
MIRCVTVYCSASSHLDGAYLKAAEELGRGIAENKWQLAFGGDCSGSMGVLAKAAHGAGGKVVGIMPKLFHEQNLASEHCHELLVTPTLRRRKEILEERGDAIVALPGGLGTLDEVLEAIEAKYVGVHDKPIVLVNVEGYFEPFVQMIERGIEKNFIRPRARELYFLAGSAEEAVGYLKTVT